MKRVYIAIVLLVLIAAGCVTTILVEKQQLTEIIKMTDRMEELVRGNEIEKARQLAEEFSEQFPKRTRPFQLFLHHSVLNNIEECIILLPLYLESDEKDDFLAEISRCRLLLQKQLEMDIPSWENVF